MTERARFHGRIAGLGTTSGVRVVVGWWDQSPWGVFADVMLADAEGRRVLLAPTDEVAAFVSVTYRFDRVEVVPVAVTSAGTRVAVAAGDLALGFTVGRRTTLGRALRVVPAPLATSPSWCRVTDPVARRLLSGVRTRGSAGGGRTESYGATDHHRVDTVHGTWRGSALGTLAPVRPDPRFGFGSTPASPSVTTLVTTVTGALP